MNRSEGKGKAGSLRQTFQRRVRYLRKRSHWLGVSLLGSLRARRELAHTTEPVTDLTRYERRIRSQNGEDGILDALFRVIGSTNRYVVEFGASNGRHCNSAFLRGRRGWTGLMMDGQKTPRSHPDVHQEFITAENIEELFARYEVPKAFDLLSIDIDGNDYWVWKAITHYEPRVVILEYNSSIPPTESRVVPYDPSFVWDRTSYYGASLLALARLGAEKGYTLVCCDNSGTNAFFVQAALAKGRFARREIAEIYRPPSVTHRRAHPPSPDREMIPI